jgi:hypothetical protein
MTEEKDEWEMDEEEMMAETQSNLDWLADHWDDPDEEDGAYTRRNAE